MNTHPRRAVPEYLPCSLLARLGSAVAHELISLGVPHTVENGHRIITEGGHDSKVELIIAGYCKISVLTAEAHKALMAVRGPGDVVGELVALGGASRSATVEASAQVSLVTLAGPVFQRFVAAHSFVAAEVTAMLGHRLAWSNRRRADAAAYPVEVRLAHLLADLSETCGRPTPDGVELLVPLTQNELAGMIGAALPTVQRALAGFRRDGLVKTGYRQIMVADPDALAGMAPAG